MTRDDIIRWAGELGCDIPSGPEGVEFFFYPAELEQFAAVVAAAEREACAKVCIAHAQKLEAEGSPAPMARICAAAIRARSQI